MSRIIQAFFLVSMLCAPAYGQEPESMGYTEENDSIRYFQQDDSIRYFQQNDSVRYSQLPDSIRQFTVGGLRTADTLVVEQTDESHSAYKAIMYALVLPGLGQGYNRKFYKIPIVYAALGGVGYAIAFNTSKYHEWSYNYSILPDQTNERGLRYFRRNLELSYIGLILVFALQVVDAYVDAQLHNWDVNSNLSMRLAPSLQPMMAPTSATGHAYGFTCSIDLRRK